MDIEGAHQVAQSVDAPRLDRRTLRAIAESQTVLPGDHTGEVEVVSESGAYTVDLSQSSCSCPDADKRGATCKHQRRGALATGAVDGDVLQRELGETLLALDSEVDRLEQRLAKVRAAKRQFQRLLEDFQAIRRQGVTGDDSAAVPTVGTALADALHATDRWGQDRQPDGAGGGSPAPADD